MLLMWHVFSLIKARLANVSLVRHSEQQGQELMWELLSTLLQYQHSDLSFSLKTEQQECSLRPFVGEVGSSCYPTFAQVMQSWESLPAPWSSVGWTTWGVWSTVVQLLRWQRFVLSWVTMSILAPSCPYTPHTSSPFPLAQDSSSESCRKISGTI